MKWHKRVSLFWSQALLPRQPHANSGSHLSWGNLPTWRCVHSAKWLLWSVALLCGAPKRRNRHDEKWVKSDQWQETAEYFFWNAKMLWRHRVEMFFWRSAASELSESALPLLLTRARWWPRGRPGVLQGGSQCQTRRWMDWREGARMDRANVLRDEVMEVLTTNWQGAEVVSFFFPALKSADSSVS